MANKEQDGFSSGRGSSFNPIQLPEVIVYGKRPLPWHKRAWNGVMKFVNDEIFLNKNNVRVKNARAHPKAMNAVQEGGNIAGAIMAAPVAAYAAVQAAPVVLPALRVAGQAMTPSTWIGGVAQATGTTAPSWLLNGADLAASAYFAYEAGKEIDKNGLNWKTGTNALMSLSPFTRDTEAIEGVANALRRPMSSVSSVVDDFRAARKFKQSVKNTRLINVPGNGLQLSKNVSSPTSSKQILTTDLYGVKDQNGFYIQQNFDGPFFEENLEWIAQNFNVGTLKTDAVGKYRLFKLGDLEKFKLRANPGGTFSLEQCLFNAYSGEEEWVKIMSGSLEKVRGYMQRVRENTMKKASPLRRELINHYNVTKRYQDNTSLDQYPSFPRVTEEVNKVLQDDIDQFYLSPEYLDRFRTQIRKHSDIYDSTVDIERDVMPDLESQFTNELYNLKDNTISVVYGTNNGNSGMSQTRVNPYIGLNANHHKLDFPEFTVTHENGHNMYHASENIDPDGFPLFDAIKELNKRNYGNPRDHVLPEVLKVANEDDIKYMTNIDEFTQRMREGIKDGILNGYSPEEIYDKSAVFERTALKSWYPKDYLVRCLGVALGLAPLIFNRSNGRDS